ncbi:pilus assembly protein PilO [Nostoc sp. FACHB-152]|uniref:pilus assembly protein PilO n=1 Tax=unclassified Nostoc TaxID=2593658 RepID=UPI0016881042|nr:MULTISPECIES: pilus assembly protein PilO [unclassified Nostoc]MBD2448735.1 pilus assembly protein PilO [Nostoc sp. FACHB-152]MBD2470178.1 pilus assembly protein PilO [Nostoc sp. FACHB-145]
MTLSEDLNFVDQGGEFDSAASPYPVVFGISFTPKIIGMVGGVVGVLGALFIVLNLVMPAWDSYQQQQAKSSDLQGQIDQKKAVIKQIEQVKQDLAKAKEQKIQVLGLFSNEKTLDTLLLDLNRLVESGNVQVPVNAFKAKLQKFAPATEKAEPVMDGSLGVGVNGKLKRMNINVEIVGTYEQTQSILRNIERLQPLLIVKDYQSVLAPVQTTNQAGKAIRQIGPAPLTTSFQLQALMPLTPEEIAAAAKVPAKK